MPLDNTYNGLFNDLERFAQTEGQGSHLEARRAYAEKGYVKSLYLIGQGDYLLEALPVIKDVRDNLNSNPSTIPSPWDGSSRRRMNERIAQMREIVRFLARTLTASGPFVPKTSGPDSPVILMWNTGDLVPAIYMAGRWKAATKLWDVIVGNWGWDGDSHPGKRLNSNEAPFPGDMS